MKLWAWLLIPAMLTAQPRPVQRGRTGARPGATAVEAEALKPEELCGLAGQVLNAATGEPLRKANLTLRRTEGRFDPGGSTSTDASGHFAMKGLEPGKYRLSVERNGFVRQEWGALRPGRSGATLTLDKGQHLRNIAFRLIPHAVIAGRVVDEEGEPLAGVLVRTMRFAFVQGRRQLMPGGSGAATNDLGEFRIFGLPPGKYYLSAEYRSTYMMMGAVDRSANDSQPEESYAAVYYPGTTDPAAAVQTDVPAGAVLRGLDLTLRKVPTVRVRGRVMNNVGAELRRSSLMLVPRGSGAFGPMSRNMAPLRDPRGTFEFRGVTPGSYLLMLDVYEENRRYTARTPVEVGSANVEGVVLVLSPGTELQGRLRVDGDAEADLGEVNVQLRTREFSPMGGFYTDRIQKDGSFTIRGVVPDTYVLGVYGLTGTWFLKSVRFGDEELRDASLRITEGASGTLEVIISPAGGQVEGLVVTAKQEAARAATVVLLPDSSRRNQTHLFKTVTTDQNGRFTLTGIAPGDYSLLAFEDLEPGAWQDADYLKQFERSAESLSIRENGHETRQLKLIPAEDAPPQQDRGETVR